MKWLERLHAPTVLAAMCVGFVLCCVAGKTAATRDLWDKKYVRMGAYIGPETLFTVPLSFFVSHVKNTLEAQQTAVIVGGSSVFFGTSQGAEHVWTQELQKELGSAYHVYNFAVRAGSIHDIARHVAEALIRDHQRVLFVSDNHLGFPTDPQGTHSSKSYWFARYNHQLLEAQFPGNPAEQAPLETKLGAWLDTHTYHNELWSYVAYHFFFTVWVQRTHEFLGAWRARKDYPDDEIKIPSDPVPTRFEKWDLAAEKERLTFSARSVCPDGEHLGFSAARQHYADNIAKIAQAFPQALARRTLVVLSQDARYFREHLAQTTQRCYTAALANTARYLRDAGLHASVFGHSEDYDDHSDRVHLSPKGGEKLARHVAVEIRKLSGELHE